jgi:hypothetical protein
MWYWVAFCLGYSKLYHPKHKSAMANAPHPNLQSRAFLAVATTALIIKLSEFLETHPGVVVTDGGALGVYVGGGSLVMGNMGWNTCRLADS